MVEMKANELRIGNYVYSKNLVLRSYSPDGLYNITSKIEDYDPIPLTEEWLLKFGFTKWKNKKIWSKNGVMVYLHAKDGFSFGKASVRTKLPYVHRLQNLYFGLKGKELTTKE